MAQAGDPRPLNALFEGVRVVLPAPHGRAFLDLHGTGLVFQGGRRIGGTLYLGLDPRLSLLGAEGFLACGDGWRTWIRSDRIQMASSSQLHMQGEVQVRRDSPALTVRCQSSRLDLADIRLACEGQGSLEGPSGTLFSSWNLQIPLCLPESSDS